MVQTAEKPQQTEPGQPDMPSPSIEGRHLSRAEQKQLFYDHLNSKVAKAAGIEVEYVEDATPDVDTNQFLKPRGFRQRRAENKAKSLIEELGRTKRFFEQDAELRAVADWAKSLAVKKHNLVQMPGSNAHHGLKMRVMTDEERLQPTPLIRRREDLDVHFKHDRLTAKAQRLSKKASKRARVARSTVKYQDALHKAQQINSAHIHPQVPEMPPEKLYFETPAHSPLRLKAVGARAFGREVLSDLAGRSASREDRHADFIKVLADSAQERLSGLQTDTDITPRGLREWAKARIVATRVNSALRNTKRPERQSRRVKRAYDTISTLRNSAQDKLPLRASAKRAVQEDHRLKARSHRSRQSKLASETTLVDITGTEADVTARPRLSHAELHILEDTLGYYQDELRHQTVGSPEYDDTQTRIAKIERRLKQYDNENFEEQQQSKAANIPETTPAEHSRQQDPSKATTEAYNPGKSTAADIEKMLKQGTPKRIILDILLNKYASSSNIGEHEFAERMEIAINYVQLRTRAKSPVKRLDEAVLPNVEVGSVGDRVAIEDMLKSYIETINSGKIKKDSLQFEIVNERIQALQQELANWAEDTETKKTGLGAR